MIFLKVLKYLTFFFLIYILFLSYTYYYPKAIPPKDWKKSEPPYPSDELKNLFWFIQISDTHISKYYDPNRGPDFRRFCSKTIDLIGPELVLVTGDLTDAKHLNRYGSEQYVDEWMEYQKILRETAVMERFTWIDLRGNHDAFDVKLHDHPESYYLKYSGDKGKRSQSVWNLVKPYGRYSFIPVEATMKPGPRRPFNFMGYLTQTQLDKLYKEGEDAMKSNLTVWYGHFPTSSISSASVFGIRSIIGQFGDVYLNGHYHDLQGIAHVLYGMHSNGFLELELSDWMKHRKFRILAVDHDMLSFTDVTHDDWPIILVTNPKPATFMMPRHEPIARMRRSTHIRFLLFNPSKITEVTVSIDGSLLEDTRHIEGPFWVSRWDADQYSKGMHRLLITVEDEKGRKKSVKSDFSLDDTWKTDFSWVGSFFILTDICTSFQMIFVVVVSVILSTLFVVKKYGASNTTGWLFKLHVLLSDDIAFYTVFGFSLNLLLGPLFFGEILSGHYGCCFAYGLSIEGKVYNEYTIYVFGLLLVLFSYLPSIFYLSHCAEMRWKKQCNFIDLLRPTSLQFLYNFLFLLHLKYQHSMFLTLYLSYGIVAGLVSPACLWWSVATLVLLVRIWYGSNMIPRSQ